MTDHARVRRRCGEVCPPACNGCPDGRCLPCPDADDTVHGDPVTGTWCDCDTCLDNAEDALADTDCCGDPDACCGCTCPPQEDDQDRRPVDPDCGVHGNDGCIEAGLTARPCPQCGGTDTWFDRSVCAEPCGSMHDRCTGCGAIVGQSCPIDYDANLKKFEDDVLAGRVGGPVAEPGTLEHFAEQRRLRDTGQGMWKPDTGTFWGDLAEDMKDPEFRKAFEQSLAEMRHGELHPARTFKEQPWWTRLRMRLRWAKEALFDDIG